MDKITFVGHRPEEYCAKVQSYPEITSCEVDAEIFQGSNRSSIQLLHNRRGTRSLTLIMDFYGLDGFERTMNQSRFESLFLGTEPVAIDVGDGFWYRAVLKKVGKPKTQSELITSVEYEFVATRHKGEELAVSFGTGAHTKMWCLSNVAKTDCVIIIDNSLHLENAMIQLNGCTWQLMGSMAGPLILDGINKTFLDGNTNVSNRIDWSDFPFLVPGENIVNVYTHAGIPVNAGVVVRYTPTFL